MCALNHSPSHYHTPCPLLLMGLWKTDEGMKRHLLPSPVPFNPDTYTHLLIGPWNTGESMKRFFSNAALAWLNLASFTAFFQMRKPWGQGRGEGDGEAAGRHEGDIREHHAMCSPTLATLAGLGLLLNMWRSSATMHEEVPQACHVSTQPVPEHKIPTHLPDLVEPEDAESLQGAKQPQLPLPLVQCCTMGARQPLVAGNGGGQAPGCCCLQAHVPSTANTWQSNSGTPMCPSSSSAPNPAGCLPLHLTPCGLTCEVRRLPAHIVGDAPHGHGVEVTLACQVCAKGSTQMRGTPFHCPPHAHPAMLQRGSAPLARAMWSP